MVRRKSLLALLLLVMAALALTLVHRALPGGRSAQAQATTDVATCSIWVGPADTYTTISAAISAAVSGDTVCVRYGRYVEEITVTTPGLTIVGIPDDGGRRPVIDGDRTLPGGRPRDRFLGLVTIRASNTVFEGFEVCCSSGRGIAVTLGAGSARTENVTLRNLDVHDNWDAGIHVRGESDSVTGVVTYVSNVTVEDNDISNNLRSAKHSPVVFRAYPTATPATSTSWEFLKNELWDKPFWDGTNTDLAEVELVGIAFEQGEEALVYEDLTFNDDGRTRRIYLGSARPQDRPGFISPDYSASGSEISYAGDDILFYDRSSKKWTVYMDGAAMGLPGSGVFIDAFLIEPVPVDACANCAPVLMSFEVPVTIPITDPATGVTADSLIGVSDVVRFTPTGLSALGEATGGYFTVYRTAAEFGGLPANVNIDAIDRAPDGRLILSLSDPTTLIGGDEYRNEDLIAYDEILQTWALFFDGSGVDYNPFPDEVTAVWVDRYGNVYLSGDPAGGSALVFIEASDSSARRNRVHNNYGEGIVAGRNSQRITLEDNVAYDNQHASIYLNSTIAPLVQRNLVYCSDNRDFWRKGATRSYRPGPGLILRDEDFSALSSTPPPSSDQRILNNIVVGCSTNFGVSTQRPGVGGLKNAIIANNTFVNARGDAGATLSNVEFSASATYDNSSFVNNLILQSSTIDSMVNIQQGQGDNPAFATFTVANNLYSSTPPDFWFNEPTSVIDDPRLVNPVLPAAGVAVDPLWYTLQGASPAFNRGQVTGAPAVDFLANPRGPVPDIGAHELVGTIIVQVSNSPFRSADQPLSFTTSYAASPFTLTNGGSRASGPLAPATSYSVAAAAEDGWITQGACSDGSSPDHVTLDPAETVICTFTSIRQAQLTVVNSLTPADAAPLFDFALSTASPFQLGNDSRTFTLAPATYQLDAAVPSDWHRTGASCSDGSAPAAVALSEGETVTCTFTHVQKGQIVVEKQTLPDGDAQTFAFSASYDGAGFSLVDGGVHTSALLAPGTYSVAETLPAGWAQTAASCSSGTPGAVDVGAGQTVTCSFTNARLGLAVTKTPTPAVVRQPGGDVTFAVDVENTGYAALGLTALTDSDYGNVASSANGAIKSTTCALPQTLQPGDRYACEFVAAVSGTAGTQHQNVLTADATGPGGATISASGNATVGIDSPLPGRIVVTKQTDPAGAPGTFAFTASYAPGGFSLSHGQSYDSGTLPSLTTYSVAETVPAGWELSSATCSGGNEPASILLEPGETVTCTFVNRRLGTAETIYLTTQTSGQVFNGAAAVAYAAGDILAYNRLTEVWSLAFDGSDVGLTRGIADFAFLPDGSILIAPVRRAVLPRNGVPGSTNRITIEPQDVVRFSPAALGETTAGTFEPYFDGSDVALSRSTEKIDALSWMPGGTYGTLLISTVDRAAVKGAGTTIRGQDEDVLAFTPATLETGGKTTGTWTMHFTGAAIPGLGVEDVTGLWRDTNGDLYLTVQNAFTVGGGPSVSGDQRTVIVVTPGTGAVRAHWAAATSAFSAAVDGLAITRP